LLILEQQVSIDSAKDTFENKKLLKNDGTRSSFLDVSDALEILA
jgi:hypothetical protein